MYICICTLYYIYIYTFLYMYMSTINPTFKLLNQTKTLVGGNTLYQLGCVSYIYILCMYTYLHLRQSPFVFGCISIIASNFDFY